MSGLLLARLLLLVGGMLLVGLGIRQGSDLLRWIGLACVAGTLAVRLVERRSRKG